jgi:hypothetical protein
MQQSGVGSIPRRVVPTTGFYGRMAEDEVNAEQFDEENTGEMLLLVSNVWVALDSILMMLSFC